MKMTAKQIATWIATLPENAEIKIVNGHLVADIAAVLPILDNPCKG